jgi:hypothetical protein
MRHDGLTVGDEDHRLVTVACLQIVEQLSFGVDVKGGSGFVEQQEVAVAEQCTRYGYTLRLTFRKSAAQFPARGVKLFGQGEYEVGAGDMEHLAHFILSGVGVAECQIIAYSAAE